MAGTTEQNGVTIEGRVRAARGPLSTDAIRRLCMSLILSEQDRLIRAGRLTPAHARPLRTPGNATADLDALPINEDVLGFDSLSIQELILSFDTFFGLHRTGIEDYFYVDRNLGRWVALIGHHLKKMGDDQVFSFRTSGSAGPAKTIRHGIRTLLAEVAALQTTVFETIPATGRCLAMVPPHHIYGFIFSCLAPSARRNEVIDCSHTPISALRHARAGDYLVGTPWHWQLLTQSAQRFAEGAHGVVSAGPSDPGLWPMTHEAGLHRLTEIYGATETGGIGWRSEATAPFTLLPHLARDNDAIRRRTDDCALLNLQDDLSWVSDQSFALRGRRDDVVQVAGVNVSPQRMRDAILAIDRVADAAVRLHNDRLKAFVVMQPDACTDPAGLIDEIKRQLRSAFPAVAVPQSIRLGAALPRNAMGKLCDWPENEASAAVNPN